MGGPKIIVFHIRQLLKTGAFVLAGLIVIILLIWALAPKDASTPNIGVKNEAKALYIAGEYNSQIILDSSALLITVTVDDNEITGVSLGAMNEAQNVLYPLFGPAMESLSKDIIRYQTTNVSYPEESKLTNQILLDAINIALSQAYLSAIDTN